MVVSCVIRDECGVMLLFIDLHYGNVVLQWMSEAFVCERVRDASSPYVFVRDDRLG